MRYIKAALPILCILFASYSPSYSQSNKPVLAIFNLQPVAPIGEGESVQITQFIQEALFYSNSYEIVERAQIDKIVKEQKYQQSGLCDDACAVAIGRQLAATKIIIGTVGRLGAAYTIQIRMLDVESGKMERISSINQKCALEDLPGFIPDLVNRLSQGDEKSAVRSMTTTPQIQAREVPSAGEVWRESVTEMEFVWISPGRFVMGSESGRSDEKPVHDVELDGFWMGKYEVTQGRWVKVMGSNPSYSKKEDDYPVEQVSWEDTQKFISRLNELNRGIGITLRLPTEAEWEYACRAGTTGDRYGNIDGVAWYSENSGSSTHPVGTKQRNAWGLYDMLGNVWEWCQNWYGTYGKGYSKNPAGPSSGSYRVYRGGSWSGGAQFVRAACRISGAPSGRRGNLGFRLARTQ
jgi:formylglycine-generating enzyme required for sulfatase activity